MHALVMASSTVFADTSTNSISIPPLLLFAVFQIKLPYHIGLGCNAVRPCVVVVISRRILIGRSTVLIIIIFNILYIHMSLIGDLALRQTLFGPFLFL